MVLVGRHSNGLHISDIIKRTTWLLHTVYPKKYAHGLCFAVLCCGYTLTDFPISIRLTSLALWQSNDCPSASKATLMNMDKYFMWIHYERLHNHNKAKHNKTGCIFLGIYCRTTASTMLNPLWLCYINNIKQLLQPSNNLEGDRAVGNPGESMMTSSKRKHLPRYWPFVRRINRPPANSPHKASDTELWYIWSPPDQTPE